MPSIGAISALLKGKLCSRTAGNVRKLWSTRCRGDLASAMCGGQWTQARKAAVPASGITDNRCQLCLDVVGIIERAGSAARRPVHLEVGPPLRLRQGWLRPGCPSGGTGIYRNMDSSLIKSGLHHSRWRAPSSGLPRLLQLRTIPGSLVLLGIAMDRCLMVDGRP